MVVDGLASLGLLMLLILYATALQSIGEEGLEGYSQSLMHLPRRIGIQECLNHFSVINYATFSFGISTGKGKKEKGKKTQRGKYTV